MKREADRTYHLHLGSFPDDVTQIKRGGCLVTSTTIFIISFEYRLTYTDLTNLLPVHNNDTLATSFLSYNLINIVERHPTREQNTSTEDAIYPTPPSWLPSQSES